MGISCANCRRSNPVEAAYCYFDGVPLSTQAAGAVSPALELFPSPFVFPQGEVSRNFDQLAQCCQHDWTAAVDLLRQGMFASFLGGLGRADLAQVANRAAQLADGDRALDQFLARLPATDPNQPKLEIEPADVDLGSIRIGEEKRFEIRIRNKGRRLLSGTVVSDSPWLTLGDAAGTMHKLIQCSRSTTLTVTVRGQYLRASPKPLEGLLVLETSGGNRTVSVRVQVPVQPFAEGCLAGAATPRQLAEKSKKSLKEAAAYFESGAVARWYAVNGWTYPVQGSLATGLGAVQQFFEALGLAKPPRLEVSQTALRIEGRAGEQQQYDLCVFTKENRPVFAQASSDSPWLKIGPIKAKANVATIPLELEVPAASAGQVLEARVHITANGNQRFDIPVSLVVEESFAWASRRGPTSRGGHRRYLVPAGVVLLLAALVSLPFVLRKKADPGPMVQRDDPPELKIEGVKGTPVKEKGPPLKRVTPVFAAVVTDEPEEKFGPFSIPVQFKIEDEPDVRTGPAPADKVKVEIKDEPVEKTESGATVLVDTSPRVAFAFEPDWSGFGISLTPESGAPALSRLLYSITGKDNLSLVRVNNLISQFGVEQSRWQKEKTFESVTTPTMARVFFVKADGTWATAGGLNFRQVLEVVPGQPVAGNSGLRRFLDTVLVRYIIQNKDNKPYTVGFRMELNTLIGLKDGVPFAIPGRPGLVDTYADFKKAKDVPDFIQAIEKPEPQDPGAIAQMTFRTAPHVEPPGRVSITRWSAGVKTWEVPLKPFRNVGAGDDSAVVLYWTDKTIKPGEKRELGFAYGLGTVASSETEGKLGVTFGGAFEPGQTFTVLAYVREPAAGQTLTLVLPDGLERVGPPATQKVAPAGERSTSIVTWTARIQRSGMFPVKVESSTGISQSKSLIVGGPVPLAKLALNLVGPFEPGQVFSVEARVADPVPGITLTMKLPPGLERVEGDETQKVAAPLAGQKDAVVTWKVKLKVPGNHAVRVASSTGIAHTKTLAIALEKNQGGDFKMLMEGDFAPGKVFAVKASVTEPLPGQALTLELPKGLERVEGAEKQVVEAGKSVPTWKVKTLAPGKFPLLLHSTTGVTARKTLLIDPPNEAVGKFGLELSGPIEPGKDFTLTAKLTHPVLGQKLKLVLPKELQLREGDAEQLAPPARNAAGSVVNWKIVVREIGRVPIRVESSTGIARTKTLTITEARNDTDDLRK